jgi:hypothetical protein
MGTSSVGETVRHNRNDQTKVCDAGSRREIVTRPTDISAGFDSGIRDAGVRHAACDFFVSPNAGSESQL